MMNFKKGKPRIIYNDDTVALRTVFAKPHTEKQISRAVDYMKNSQIDCVCWSMFTGVSYSYYSNVIENFYDMVENDPGFFTRNLEHDCDLTLSLHKQGVDYLPVLINKFHAENIDFYASFRMNDTHHKSRPRGKFAPEFWKNHQHYRLWEVQDGRSYYNATLDYSYPEVRQKVFDSIVEVLTRYDVDGIELDFCRNPYLFQPSEAWGKRDILTELILAIRNKINEFAQKDNKEIKLIIRVPFSDEKLKQGGMDVKRWLENKYLDILVMSNHFNDYNEQSKKWLELCKEKNILFYPSIELLPKINPHPDVDMPIGATAPKDNYEVPPNYRDMMNRMRGMAQNYLAQEPDGSYMFNYPCGLFETNRTSEEFTEMTSILHEIGSLETLENKPKEYLFWGDLPIYIEALRPAKYHQTIKFNIMDKSLNKSSKVVFSFIRAIEDSPHNYEKSEKQLPDNYIKTMLNGTTLDEKTFKKQKEDPGTIISGYTIGEHEKFEIMLTGDDILYGENTLAFEMPHFPENDSPYVYIYELCVETCPSQK
jgi:glycosyl hydrolase family 10